MSDHKQRRLQIDLSPIQVVWLQTQLVFQKIEDQLSNSRYSVQFYKQNHGIEIRVYGSTHDDCSEGLTRASEDLSRIVSSNDIRLLRVSLHKDDYIRISKEARVKFTRTYITFVHYDSIENCGKRMNEKHGITSISAEAERLKKENPRFCYLIAQKDKYDEILKFTYQRAEAISAENQKAVVVTPVKNTSPSPPASAPFLKKSSSKFSGVKAVTKRYPRLEK